MDLIRCSLRVIKVPICRRCALPNNAEVCPGFGCYVISRRGKTKETADDVTQL